MSAPSRSRAGALALLAGVLTVALAAIVVPAASSWSGNGATIRAERLKVLRAEERERTGETIAAARTEWTGFVRGGGSGLVVGADAAEAEANVRARIEGLFAARGGSVSRLETEIAEAARKGVSRIAVSLEGDVAKDELGPLLGALESTAPFLLIRRFEGQSASGERIRIEIEGSVYRLDEAPA